MKSVDQSETALTAPVCSGFEPLARGIYLEGLAVAPDSETVWFSDVVGGGVHSVAPGGGQHSVDVDRLWTGGVLMNADGSVLSSGEGGIRWNHPASGESGWLLSELDSGPINGINEMVPDGQGGLFFGTCDIESVKRAVPTRSTQVWHLSSAHDLRCLCPDIGFANGMMFDFERRRFYCNDSFSGTWVFDVSDALTLEHRERFCDKYDADGMALDAEGNVWITGFASRQISRFSANGAALDGFDTPGGAVTQVRFLGADLRELVITTVPVDGGQNLKNGTSMVERNSVLYRCRSPVRGRAVGVTAFDLRKTPVES